MREALEGKKMRRKKHKKEEKLEKERKKERKREKFNERRERNLIKYYFFFSFLLHVYL